MKVTSITPNYNQKSQSNAKNNQPVFGNFVEVIIPYSLIKGEKGIKDLVETVKSFAESIKKLTKEKVNVYRMSLEGMAFRKIFATDIFHNCARTLFIEDNNGKNLPELLDSVKYLIESKGVDSKIYAGDLFAPKKKGLLEISNLDKTTYGAKPEQMIKL